MSWRTVVISNRAKLDLQMNYMVIRMDTVTKIHLSEISVLLIESTAVSITTSLLAELTKKKIKVIFCDEKKCHLLNWWHSMVVMTQVKSIKSKLFGQKK